jgi:hypothetical protein
MILVSLAAKLSAEVEIRYSPLPAEKVNSPLASVTRVVRFVPFNAETSNTAPAMGADPWSTTRPVTICVDDWPNAIPAKVARKNKMVKNRPKYDECETKGVSGTLNRCMM